MTYECWVHQYWPPCLCTYGIPGIPCDTIRTAVRLFLNLSYQVHLCNNCNVLRPRGLPRCCDLPVESCQSVATYSRVLPSPPTKHQVRVVVVVMDRGRVLGRVVMPVLVHMLIRTYLTLMCVGARKRGPTLQGLFSRVYALGYPGTTSGC